MRESDKAYEAIHDLMLDGTLRCGSTINDELLQKQLKIGKTPLREALVRLVQDGYVTTVPHRGMYVATYDVAQLESILNLRASLNAYHCQLLNQNATDEAIDACEEQMRALVKACDINSLGSISHVDYRFHQMLAELSGDAVLAGILNKLTFMSSMALVPHFKDYFVNEQAVIQEYFDVFDYLRKRNYEELEETLRRHIPRYVLQRG